MLDPPATQGESDRPSPLDVVRARTPARILIGRVGSSYRTETLLELRRDHAAALDAVRVEMDAARSFGPEFIERFGLFEVRTQAVSKSEFLMRPNLGRCLTDESSNELETRCPKNTTFQVAIGDGLSAAAVAAQVPALLPLLESGAIERGWTFGRPFLVRYCRVGVLNELGERLSPSVVVLLIGERPGLATAESLSAYMAYRPRAGDSDARRNLVSNIHARGLPPEEAARRIFALAESMLRQETSGVRLEEGPSKTVLDHE
jgi:ethanolamine ammonia-lyase small subunit